ncbi:hypothetical protein SmJEL517_g05800 [Synchytrium microbalum]|uniref:Splicing factor 3B subunit 4 n=1 Tax=Synchytrium microbalum TaxID=1806994 RepID=A0A507BSR1_9FUNG|nr:uncharacterized protein SmJEL517_g05800 [Synchytrium microbalum]TPX30692.1 hypothetical protein SmJEL517_g05800 [Synchytrium microbalum]
MQSVPGNTTIERNQDATVYIGNLDDRSSEAIVWELMLQAGPVVNVHLPKDRVTMAHQGYGFCEFATEEDADYAIKIMNMIKLFGKPIRVNKATSDKKNLEVGANLFIGNLDPDVDEKLLYDTFSAFGQILQTPKIARDLENGNSKGYGFVGFDNFESADAAIEAMNGQYLANKPVNVTYAFKKDGKGERHGTAAERLLAAQAKKNQPTQLPNRLFAEIPGQQQQQQGMPQQQQMHQQQMMPPSVATGANAIQMVPPMGFMPPPQQQQVYGGQGGFGDPSQFYNMPRPPPTPFGMPPPFGGQQFPGQFGGMPPPPPHMQYNPQQQWQQQQQGGR